MRASNQALELLRELEGESLKAYRDGGGVPTIGNGHTRGVRMGMVITDAQRAAFLVEDIEEAEATIHRYLPDAICAALPQAAWDALVIFVFNLGDQAFVNEDKSLTGICRALLRRAWSDVPHQMRRWIYDNGERVQGLVNRRDKEAELWASAWESGDAAVA